MSELKNYVRFTSDNPKLDFSFLYPGDWQLREVKGAGHDEVSILGPRNKEDTYSLGLTVSVLPAKGIGGQHTRLSEFIADYLTKNQRFAKFQEISRATGNLAGVDATEIEISYVMPLPINTVNPRATSIVERSIFLKKGDHFYEVTYGAVEEDYYEYLNVFKDMVRTFEFREDAYRRVYRPLVVPAPAPTIREGSTEYKTGE